MVTTSFTLRKTSAERGSYLQNNGTDSLLRADKFVVEAATPSASNSFTANVININEVMLSWELSFLFSASAGLDGYGVKEIAVVSSPTGEPITYKDGSVVTTVSSDTTTTFTDIARVSAGRWVYYSLFIKYSNFEATPTEWYERAATLYVQIPKEYNSINNLWARIPEYYRNLDYELHNSPLYNFLELFGWEIDRTRTLIDSIGVSNDPDLAVTPALRELAYETGLEIDIDVLGTTKARNLLNNIGSLRRRKGTVESIASYLSAIAGSEVTYTTTGSGASASYDFNVHNQRINFAADPTFFNATYTTTTGVGATNRVGLTKTDTWGVYSYGDTSTTGASAVSANETLTVKNVGTGTIQVLVYQRTAFPYYQSAYLYAGFTPTLSAGASFNNFHVSTTAKQASWESNVTGGSVPSSLYFDTWNTVAQPLPVSNLYPNEMRYEIDPNSTETTTVNVVPVLHFSLDAGATITINRWLVEPYSISEYFDGDSNEGGLIPELTGFGSGSSDYRWASSPNTSFSYYLLDYKRVYEVSQNIIRNYVAPVTIKDNVNVLFNYYHGA
jgi:hypothetical protein